LRKQIAIEPVFAIEIPNARRDFLRRPVANGLLEKSVFGGKIEIQSSSALP
jgi:hypothetical protein